MIHVWTTRREMESAWKKTELVSVQKDGGVGMKRGRVSAERWGQCREVMGTAQRLADLNIKI